MLRSLGTTWLDKALANSAARFKEARSFEDMKPLCDKIFRVAAWPVFELSWFSAYAYAHVMLPFKVQALKIEKGKAKGLITELKKR